MAYPTNYRYTREHEWIQLDGQIGTVGITDYAPVSYTHLDVYKRQTRKRRAGDLGTSIWMRIQ